jgi:hypothetical protein
MLIIGDIVGTLPATLIAEKASDIMSQQTTRKVG